MHFPVKRFALLLAAALLLTGCAAPAASSAAPSSSAAPGSSETSGSSAVPVSSAAESHEPLALRQDPERMRTTVVRDAYIDRSGAIHYRPGFAETWAAQSPEFFARLPEGATGVRHLAQEEAALTVLTDDGTVHILPTIPPDDGSEPAFTEGMKTVAPLNQAAMDWVQALTNVRYLIHTQTGREIGVVDAVLYYWPYALLGTADGLTGCAPHAADLASQPFPFGTGRFYNGDASAPAHDYTPPGDTDIDWPRVAQFDARLEVGLSDDYRSVATVLYTDGTLYCTDADWNTQLRGLTDVVQFGFAGNQFLLALHSDGTVTQTPCRKSIAAPLPDEWTENIVRFFACTYDARVELIQRADGAVYNVTAGQPIGTFDLLDQANANGPSVTRSGKIVWLYDHGGDDWLDAVADVMTVSPAD